MSQSDNLRIAIALTALKFKPPDQSCASFVLELRSKFPASEPSAPTSDGSWKTHALNLERKVAQLQQKYEDEQIRCLSLTRDGQRSNENLTAPQVETTATSSSLASGPVHLLGQVVPTGNLTDVEGGATVNEKSTAKKKKKKDFRRDKEKETTQPLNTTVSSPRSNDHANLRLEAVLDGLIDDLNVLPTQRLSSDSLFSTLSSFSRICSSIASTDSSVMESHSHCANRHTLQCQETLLLSSATRTVKATALILTGILELHMNGNEDEHHIGKSIGSQLNFPSSGTTSSIPATSDRSKRDFRSEARGTRFTRFSRSISTLKALNTLLCHLLSVCAPILSLSYSSKSLSSDMVSKKASSKLHSIYASSHSPNPDLSANSSQAYLLSEDQPTFRHKPDAGHPKSQTHNSLLDFDNHLESEKFVDALTLNIFSPIIHSVYPLSEQHLRGVFSTVATSKPTRKPGPARPNEADNDQARAAFQQFKDIRTDILAFFRDILENLVSSSPDRLSFPLPASNWESTLTDLTDYLCLLTTREIIKIYDPSSSAAPPASTSVHGQDIRSKVPPRNPTQNLFDRSNTSKTFSTSHSKDPPGQSLNNSNRIEPTAYSGRLPTQKTVGTRVKVNRVEKPAVLIPENIKIRDAERSNPQHMEMCTDDRHIKHIINNDDPVDSHQRLRSYPHVYSLQSRQLHSDPLALSVMGSNNLTASRDVDIESSFPRNDYRRTDSVCMGGGHDKPCVLPAPQKHGPHRIVQGLDAARQEHSGENSAQGPAPSMSHSMLNIAEARDTNPASSIGMSGLGTSAVHCQGGVPDGGEKIQVQAASHARTKGNDSNESNTNQNQRNNISVDHGDKNRTPGRQRGEDGHSNTRSTRIQRLARKEAVWYLCAMLHVLIEVAESRVWKEKEKTSSSREFLQVLNQVGTETRKDRGGYGDEGGYGSLRNEVEDGILRSCGSSRGRDIDGYDGCSTREFDGYGAGYGYDRHLDGYQDVFGKDGRDAEDARASRPSFEKNVHRKSGFAHSDYQSVRARSRGFEDVRDKEDSGSRNRVPDDSQDATASSTRVWDRGEGGGPGDSNLRDAPGREKDSGSLLRKGMVDALLGLLERGRSTASFASNPTSGLVSAPHCRHCSCSGSGSGGSVRCKCGARRDVPGFSGTFSGGVEHEQDGRKGNPTPSTVTEFQSQVEWKSQRTHSEVGGGVGSGIRNDNKYFGCGFATGPRLYDGMDKIEHEMIMAVVERWWRCFPDE